MFVCLQHLMTLRTMNRTWEAQHLMQIHRFILRLILRTCSNQWPQ